MEEENEDPMLFDPEILKKELVISLPTLNKHDIEKLLNGGDVDSSWDDEDLSSDDEKEKPCVKRDQRRLDLLNNPNYGLVLCFLDQFRSYMNIKKYPLKLFEDNLINEQEKISRRLIDFHLFLLKKVSSGKGNDREQFVPSITKFSYQFNRDDGDHLEEYGYAKARIDIKVRILKNLVEKQFDRNQSFKNAIANELPYELRSKPFGRDRFGASYWLFMDDECFIRVFRENIDNNRTWIYLAKNREELESIIKRLITDHVVRKKFPGWRFAYEAFNYLSTSNQFQDHYSPNIIDLREDKKVTNQLRRSPSNTTVLLHPDFIKMEHIDLDPVVDLSRDMSTSLSLSSFMIDHINNIKVETSKDLISDQDSINSCEINSCRLSIASSNDERESLRKTIQERCTTQKNDKQVVVLNQGIKRKLVDYDDSDSEMEDNEKNDETSQDSHQNLPNKQSEDDPDLPIALRRSRRGGRTLNHELLSSSSSSTIKSLSQTGSKKKFVNGTRKISSQFSKTNGRRRRRGGKSSIHGFSSTTSDELHPSDDDDFDSEEYLPNKTPLDELIDNDFLEENNNDNAEEMERRKAKTVAKCLGHIIDSINDQIGIPLKACRICLNTDRPESLLLCEDCDDAYHLECVKPELLSIPDYHWFCPLCEHKCLCDNLIEKLLILIKDHDKLEMKRRLFISKRRKRLTNVTVNLDRFVKPPSTNKRRINLISSSDEDDGRDAMKKKIIDDDDVDSVYGCKNDENRKPSDQKEAEDKDESEKRGPRACRQKAQSYSLDDYDKKMKEAMIHAGIKQEEVEVVSDISQDMHKNKTLTKKSPLYEHDDDFDGSDGRNHDEDFVPSRRRITDDDSRSGITKENNDDFGMSDDDIARINRRQSSTSSLTKRKSTPKNNRVDQRKSTIISEDDNILSEANLSNLPPAVNLQPEPKIDLNRNKPAAEKQRRQRRPTKPKKKPSIQQENISDEEETEDTRPPPAKRLPHKKRRDSNASSLDDDDDYEKLAHKRQLFTQGRATTRTSITRHIKKLVGDEEEDEEEETPTTADEPSALTAKDNDKDTSKAINKKLPPQYDELKLSDDDDFPDDQEILKTTGLTNLKKTLTGPKAATALRAPFMPPVQTYHYVMADPTAHFDVFSPPEPLTTQPSDTNIANGNNGLSTTTTA